MTTNGSWQARARIRNEQDNEPETIRSLQWGCCIVVPLSGGHALYEMAAPNAEVMGWDDSAVQFFIKRRVPVALCVMGVWRWCAPDPTGAVWTALNRRELTALAACYHWSPRKTKASLHR